MRIPEGQPATALIFLLIGKRVLRARRVTSSGVRFYSPELGRWLNRDPIGEQGGIPLCAFVGNEPSTRHDAIGLALSLPPEFAGVSHLAESLLARIRGAVGFPTSLFTRLFVRAMQESASGTAAVGVQGVGHAVPLTGFILGYNVMFFPDTCEVARFRFGSGTVYVSEAEEMWDGLDSVRDILPGLLHTLPAGGSVGIQVEGVSATPIGTGVHGAESWAGWFYGLNAGPIGFFGSNKWLGVSATIMGVSGGGNFAATFYEQDGPAWDVEATSQCLCAALRACALASTRPVSGINIGVRQLTGLLERALED